MATTTLTETSSTSSITIDDPHVYGCEHVESLLKKHGDRTRQEYDSAMSVVIQPASKTTKVKVILYLSPVDVDVSRLPGSHAEDVDVFQLSICRMYSQRTYFKTL
jgi:hypothetical protein